MKILYAMLISLCSISGVFAETADEYFQKGMDAYRKSDFTTAFQLHQKACNGGSADSCNVLGIMYLYGQGVNKILSKLLNYYRKPATTDLVGVVIILVMCIGIVREAFNEIIPKLRNYTKRVATMDM